jgi:hypothetical protein
MLTMEEPKPFEPKDYMEGMNPFHKNEKTFVIKMIRTHKEKAFALELAKKSLNKILEIIIRYFAFIQDAEKWKNEKSIPKIMMVKGDLDFIRAEEIRQKIGR